MRVWGFHLLFLLATNLVVASRDKFPVAMTMLTDDEKDSWSTDTPRQLVLMVGPPSSRNNALGSIHPSDHQSINRNRDIQITQATVTDFERNDTLESVDDGSPTTGNSAADVGRAGDKVRRDSGVRGFGEWLKRRRMKRRLSLQSVHFPATTWRNPSGIHSVQRPKLPLLKSASTLPSSKVTRFGDLSRLREETDEKETSDDEVEPSLLQLMTVQEESDGGMEKRDRKWLGRRNTKRYRLGLYDCIVSYCNTMAGDDRKRCIAYNCHRSLE